jgi:hypothetical protein
MDLPKDGVGEFHALVYGYPLIEKDFERDVTSIDCAVNTSRHYSIPNSDHLIGVKLNQAGNG